MTKISVPGKLVFAFSFEDNGKERFYHILYNEQVDLYKNRRQLVGAVYKMMKDYPDLIEPIACITQQAIEEMTQPFHNILHEKPKK